MTSTTSESLILSIATAVASAAHNNVTQTLSSAASTATSSPGDDESSGECKLLGSWAIVVQTALGAVALLSLVFKRWKERPQRPVKVWAFDASKQVVGSMLLHLANLAMSMFSAGNVRETIAAATASTERYQPNPCSFYLLNLAIDTTLGIPILIGILKIVTVGAGYTPLANPVESIKSGHYGNPPRTTWWLKQCLIYFIGLTGMKACVFIIFQLCPWLGRVGDWALRWTEGNEAVQIAFVMFIFPVIMNAMQYYVIDTFIKGRKEEGPESGDNVDEDDHEHGRLLAEDPSTQRTSIDDDEASNDLAAESKQPYQSKLVASYDPDKDGEATETGQSSSLASHAEQEAIDNRPRE